MITVPPANVFLAKLRCSARFARSGLNHLSRFARSVVMIGITPSLASLGRELSLALLALLEIVTYRASLGAFFLIFTRILLKWCYCVPAHILIVSCAPPPPPVGASFFIGSPPPAQAPGASTLV